ncbi:MAG: Formimidoylglutamase [Bacteroidota bacterium]|jgi:arginase family enzyme
MFEEYLTGISTEATYKPYQIGACITKYESVFPSLDHKKIAIIGVPESRNNEINKDSSLAPDAIREQLYTLTSNPVLEQQLVDLGNLIIGETFEDTLIALQDVLSILHKRKILTIVLGGDVALGQAIYTSFQNIAKNVDLSYISAQLPILQGELLDTIISHQPNFLLNLNAIAFQGHFLPAKALDILQNMNFGHARLGSLKKNVEDAELLLRNTNLVLFDIDAVKHADAPGNANSNPIGIDGDLACQLSWYAGVSDTSKSFGLFNVNPDLDNREQTVMLASQIIWYFMDGFCNRKHDHPSLHDEFIRYRCNLDNKQPDLLFHKSKRTNRWWMEIPHPRSLHNPEMNVVIPCSYADYQTAAAGDIPDRYLNALHKLH